MATIHRAASLVVRDCRGWTCPVRWTQAFDDSALTAAMAAAVTVSVSIVSMTNAIICSTGGLASEGVQGMAWGNNVPWPSVSHKAVMTWRTVSGILVEQRIPAPSSAIFLADGATVDVSNGLVTAYISAVLASGVTNRNGDYFSGLVAGHMESKATRRRIGTTIRDPNALASTDY